MKKRQLKGKTIVFTMLLSLILFLSLASLIFKFMLGSTGNKEETILFTVPKASTYLTLSSFLKESNLIKNELAYKIYVRIKKPSNLQAGIYQLNQGMDVEELIQTLEKGTTYNPDAVTITIPEGKHLEEVAEIVSEKTNNTKEELLSVWNSESFLSEAKEKYWFLTDDISNSKIRYSLEGYLFPSTYELTNADVTPQYIAYKMLDGMDQILSKYKEEIEKSNYSIHELLTMASIVEYEAIDDIDRPVVASVFYNRLDDNMKLQSCATIGYALGEWKLTYSSADLNVDSLYNTYFYSGLPVGPGCMPSEESIKAAIYPSTTEYYYFMANVCDTSSTKTYFAKTYAEHQENIRKYLTCIYGN